MGMRSIGTLGPYPRTASNGLMPIDLLTKLLYADSAVGNMESHDRIHFCSQPQSGHLFVGDAEENQSSVPIMIHSVFQK